ncbi:MAG: phosphoribosyl-ATP diphosphatase [Methanoregula sp.]|nr:phosphoribosyl-ATP diphosphatase [Methanoregula sp.]
MNRAVDTRMIAEIWAVICERAENPRPESYTTRLLTDKKGIDKVLEKVGEESTEFILAIKNGVNERTVEETADLLFHLLVALRSAGIDLNDVMKELEHRRK